MNATINSFGNRIEFSQRATTTRLVEDVRCASLVLRLLKPTVGQKTRKPIDAAFSLKSVAIASMTNRFVE